MLKKRDAYVVAVVGATGAVGNEMIATLEERDFPVKKLRLFARDPARFLAKRFAAKEAFAKAAGTGLRHPLNLRNLAITHTPLGQPGLHFHPELAFWLHSRGITGHHLSLSDEQEYVIAYVVLEKT